MKLFGWLRKAECPKMEEPEDFSKKQVPASEPMIEITHGPNAGRRVRVTGKLVAVFHPLTQQYESCWSYRDAAQKRWYVSMRFAKPVWVPPGYSTKPLAADKLAEFTAEYHMREYCRSGAMWAG